MECCTADLPARVLDTEPARIIDRSFHGVGCIVPGLARLEPGQRVTVTVGDHQRAGTISRVRGFGNQVRVGVRLDEI